MQIVERAARRVAADQLARLAVGEREQAAREGGEERLVGARQGQRERERERPRAAGGEVAQVDRERLVAEPIGRHGRQEVAALDQHVGRDRERRPGRRLQERAVVADAERGAPHRPREEALDELEFAEVRPWCGRLSARGSQRRRAATGGNIRSPPVDKSAMIVGDRAATSIASPRAPPCPNSEQKAAELRRAALDYHEFPTPGKVAIAATKQLVNQHDLALAYSPGVAAACEEIVADPANAFRYTARGNLVAVITNGTAVLGLGDIGPLAAKPVMEGKGVLFKKFAGIDVFDIEVNEKNLDKLIDLIAALEPTFGGINLEDIKAPDCFYVERRAALADEDPGLPRRPARHRDRRRRRRAERAQGERQEDRRGQARHLGRRRRRARLPGPARQARHAAREHLGHRPRRRRLPGPHRADGRRQDRVRAGRRRSARSPR